MTSPSSSPASAAGEPASTLVTSTPASCSRPAATRVSAGDRRALGGDADPAASHPAVAQQLAQHERGSVRGDREADALRALDHRGVDAHDLASRRHQRAAGVAWIERGVGLDQVLQLAPALAAQRAAERRNHAGGDGGLEAERVADRHHQPPAPQLLRVAEPRGGQRHRIVGAQQGEVGVGIVAQQPRGQVAAIGRHDIVRRRLLGDVAVGEDQAVGRDDHARPDAAAAFQPGCTRTTAGATASTAAVTVRE